jgi:hypothetical protein
MPGLDPGIHAVEAPRFKAGGMDCRVKPGNDGQFFAHENVIVRSASA